MAFYISWERSGNMVFLSVFSHFFKLHRNKHTYKYCYSFSCLCNCKVILQCLHLRPYKRGNTSTYLQLVAGKTAETFLETFKKISQNIINQQRLVDTTRSTYYPTVKSCIKQWSSMVLIEEIARNATRLLWKTAFFWQQNKQWEKIERKNVHISSVHRQ